MSSVSALNKLPSAMITAKKKKKKEHNYVEAQPCICFIN